MILRTAWRRPLRKILVTGEDAPRLAPEHAMVIAHADLTRVHYDHAERSPDDLLRLAPEPVELWRRPTAALVRPLPVDTTVVS
eukprot:6742397-Pyramimonas_sp.AAC.1